MAGKRQVKGISKALLDLVREASKSSHPHEFAALLREVDGVIGEMLLVPGTTSNDTSAHMLLDMMPLDLSVVGSVHSHPVHDLRYSEEDLHMFGAKGIYNIIVAYPYDEHDWICYGPGGYRVELPVIVAEGK
jgi:Predicted metal-dependent protease of the PAD1/JAB1 superfamily